MNASPPPVPDEALMRRVQLSLDENAFQTLLTRYYRRALALAQSWLRSSSEAEDIVQESFLRVLRNRHDYDPQRRFASWYYTILRNCCTDCLRRETRYRHHLTHLPPPADRSSSKTAAERLQAALEALDALSLDDRNILRLKLLDALPLREIARRLGCSEEAAKKRAQRAFQNFRRQMENTKP